jgi:mannose-6-phosphate isomerase
VGEIWFDLPGGDPELLVKYLFTSERLSIQVHPDDGQARTLGFPRGKDEAWVILAADEDARIALGTVRPVGAAELRTAALDGSIEQLMDWKPVQAGDTIYSPAGTVHAIGAGITLIEVQQNVDLTYRLYDYGRPRPLHLDEAVAVADACPFRLPPPPIIDAEGRERIAATEKFILERWHWSGERRLALRSCGWLIPVAGDGEIGGVGFVAGECLLVEGTEILSPRPGSDLLFASTQPFRLDPC